MKKEDLEKLIEYKMVVDNWGNVSIVQDAEETMKNFEAIKTNKTCSMGFPGCRHDEKTVKCPDPISDSWIHTKPFNSIDFKTTCPTEIRVEYKKCEPRDIPCDRVIGDCLIVLFDEDMRLSQNEFYKIVEFYRSLFEDKDETIKNLKELAYEQVHETELYSNAIDEIEKIVNKFCECGCCVTNPEEVREIKKIIEGIKE